MALELTSSDVWLLLAVALAESEPPVRLPDVLAAGDTINHAVFTPQELRRGFSKLTRAGYVIDDAGAYSLLPAGRAMVDEARIACSENWLRMWQYLEKRLGATSGPENAPQYEDPLFSYSLTDEAVARADSEYRAKFAQLLAGIEAEDP